MPQVDSGTVLSTKWSTLSAAPCPEEGGREGEREGGGIERGRRGREEGERGITPSS